MVRAHRELISQALANLVDNAIKYAAPARQPKAELALAGDVAMPADQDAAAGARVAAPAIIVTAATDKDTVVLTVTDRGPGIPPEARARAVERFVRLEQSRSLPGSGLGLSLAAAVAHLHHGELKLDDNAPGLKAMIVLPRAGPPISG
jgi:signal transduction histidine kinase